VLACLKKRNGRLCDRPHLQTIDLGIDDADAAAAESNHGVEFLEFVVPLHHPLHIGNSRCVSCCSCFRKLALEALPLRQELMERGIQQTNDDGVPIHCLKNLLEVPALQRQEFLESNHALRWRIGNDHLLHERQAVRIVEHSLGAAESDALAPNPRALRALVGVSAFAAPEPAQFVGIAEQGRQFRSLLCVDHGRWPRMTSPVCR